MEQRREPRFAADQTVQVTILGTPAVRCTGVVKDASGRGVGLALPVAVAVGAAIRIDIPDCLLLGEAVFCRKSGDGFVVGVELQQMLNGLARLAEVVGEFREVRLTEPA
ncbi:MAG TPA: PilZ domain-containing protein [Candidatus Limnocylindrales bacterium]|nr:PilZ domain-containing protein [Candidatus Limnocylindrales bacterium]